MEVPLERAQVRHLLALLSEEPRTNDHVALLIDKVDENRSGDIDFEELAMLIRAFNPQLPRPKDVDDVDIEPHPLIELVLALILTLPLPLPLPLTPAPAPATNRSSTRCRHLHLVTLSPSARHPQSDPDPDADPGPTPGPIHGAGLGHPAERHTCDHSCQAVAAGRARAPRTTAHHRRHAARRPAQ